MFQPSLSSNSQERTMLIVIFLTSFLLLTHTSSQKLRNYCTVQEQHATSSQELLLILLLMFSGTDSNDLEKCFTNTQIVRNLKVTRSRATWDNVSYLYVWRLKKCTSVAPYIWLCSLYPITLSLIQQRNVHLLIKYCFFSRFSVTLHIYQLLL
jgi:hypothetical protein